MHVLSGLFILIGVSLGGSSPGWAQQRCQQLFHKPSSSVNLLDTSYVGLSRKEVEYVYEALLPQSDFLLVLDMTDLARTGDADVISVAEIERLVGLSRHLQILTDLTSVYSQNVNREPKLQTLRTYVTELSGALLKNDHRSAQKLAKAFTAAFAKIRREQLLFEIEPDKKIKNLEAMQSRVDRIAALLRRERLLMQRSLPDVVSLRQENFIMHLTKVTTREVPRFYQDDNVREEDSALLKDLKPLFRGLREVEQRLAKNSAQRQIFWLSSDSDLLSQIKSFLVRYGLVDEKN
jgi:hypothetical protein